MIKILMQCESCRGVFEVSNSFFNGKDTPRFCTFCGKDKLIVLKENDYSRQSTIELTLDQSATLSTFLLMTTKYREGELEACRELGKELDENGNIKYPNIVANAKWWEGAISIIEEIQELL